MRVDAVTAATTAAAPQPSAQALDAAKGFEQLLVQQLAQTLVESTSTSEDDASPAAQLLPDALAQSISQAGGLGLAARLAQELPS